MAKHEEKPIITYTAVMDKMYENGRLMYIAGRGNPCPDGLVTIPALEPAAYFFYSWRF